MKYKLGADGARSKQPMLLSNAWNKGLRRIAANFSGVMAVGLAFTARRSLFTPRAGTGAWFGELGSTSEVAIGT